MADIRPFQAWRYAEHLSPQITNLVSPLFDVVSEKQRQKLYQNPLNSIHVSVPQAENVGDSAQKTFAEWKAQNILVKDEKPAIYAYYQYFSLPNAPHQYCRKGFICLVRAYDWEEKMLLRHENTLPKAVNDRIEILEKTQMQVSPTHGLYTDSKNELEALLDHSLRNTIYETEDYQGVRDILARIDDPETIALFQEKLASEKIILADGHHRYESSLAIKNRRKAENTNHTGEERYNFHLMYLTNTASDDLKILPTHRLVSNLPNFETAVFLEKLKDYFTIIEIENPTEIDEIIRGKSWAFGVLLKENAFKIRLKPEVFGTIAWKFPPEVLRLDVTVLHYFVLEQVLGIKGKEHRQSPYLSYERNFTECWKQVNADKAQIGLIANAVSIEEVRSVCYSGAVMPPKSTYFYPKALCGLVFAGLE